MIDGYTQLKPFRFWVQKVLPTVYDDSLSYYELLNKVVEYLNTMGEDVNLLYDTTEQYTQAFLQLKEFVETYFDNLDVQEEIDAKLDEMAESGELQEAFMPYLEPTILNTVEGWLDENISGGETIALDNTLTLPNAAAPAITVGDKFKQTLSIKTPQATSIDELIETGVYLNISTSSEETIPTYAGAPFTPCLIICSFASTGSYGYQLFYPYYNTTNQPLMRVRTTSGGVSSWSGFTEFNNLYRNVKGVTTQQIGADPFRVTQLPVNSYWYGFKSHVVDAPDGWDDTDLLYVESKRANAGNTVDFIIAYNFAKSTIAFCYSPEGLRSKWYTTLTQPEAVEEIANDWTRFGMVNALSGMMRRPAEDNPETHYGVNWWWDEENYCYRCSGTPTQNSFLNVYALKAPPWMKSGKQYVAKIESSDSSKVIAQILFKVNGSYGNAINIIDKTTFTIPDVYDNILVRLYTRNNVASVNDSISVAIGVESSNGTVMNINNYVSQDSYTVNVSPSISSSTPYLLESTGDTTDRTAEINAMLQTNKCCVLGRGNFYVTNITVPQGATLCGSGTNATQIIMLSTATGNAISLKTDSNVRDLKVFGGAATKPTTEGTRNGVAWNGDFISPQQPGTLLYRAAVTNVNIYGFNGAGLYQSSTGRDVSSGILAANMRIYRCYRGIGLIRYAEYSKFINIDVEVCYIGCENNGGNNLFSNCSFNTCNTGFIINAPNTEVAPNSAHGTVSACTINHSGPDLQTFGNAIVVNGSLAGFVFTGCQIFKGDIVLSNAQGIHFDSCNIDEDVDISINGGGLYYFSGTIFETAPSVTKANSPVVVSSGCYLRDGTPVSI